MHRLLPALLLAAACTEPQTSSTEAPIIGGTLVTVGEFPTVVALESSPGNWFCTGSLVDKNWVLTAAHCVAGAPNNGVKIRIDDLDVNDTIGGQQVAVKSIHRDPGYGADWGEDLALLELAVAIDRPVTPIHRTPIGFDTAVTQVGYGVTNDQGTGGGILRKLAEHNIDCTTTGDPDTLNAEVLCFSPMDGGGCYGDSGGPTFLDVGGGKLEVIGVTSGGTGQNCSDSFGIWTLVPAELTWIDSVMQATPPDPDPMPDPEPMPDPMPDPTPMPEPQDDDGGCSTTSGGSGALALMLLAVLRRRRR